MPGFKRLTLALALALALLTSRAGLCAQPGSAAPPLQLPRAGGGGFSLQDALRHGPVVLWFPDLPSARPGLVEPLHRIATEAGATLALIPVSEPTAAWADELATRLPGVLILLDPTGRATLDYCEEFIPGISPRQNLFLISQAGRILLARSWPGVPESTLTEHLKARP